MHLNKGKETFVGRYIGETVKNYQVNNCLQINVKAEQNNSYRLKMQTSARKMGFHKKHF